MASLKARLRVVKGGEEIVVTERGRQIARLTPVTGESQHDTRLAPLPA
jgi:antitoxin (DNA-binding transcriptional repressor) of toxin-antitoxin stability system